MFVIEDIVYCMYVDSNGQLLPNIFINLSCILNSLCLAGIHINNIFFHPMWDNLYWCGNSRGNITAVSWMRHRWNILFRQNEQTMGRRGHGARSSRSLRVRVEHGKRVPQPLWDANKGRSSHCLALRKNNHQHSLSSLMLDTSYSFLPTILSTGLVIILKYLVLISSNYPIHPVSVVASNTGEQILADQFLLLFLLKLFACQNFSVTSCGRFVEIYLVRQRTNA